MATIDTASPDKSLLVLLAIPMVAFFSYHIEFALFFNASTDFFRANPVMNFTMVIIVKYGALYLPTAFHFWFAIRYRRLWIAHSGVALLSAWAAYAFHYPLLTAFLQSLGHTEPYLDLWWMFLRQT